MKFEGKTFYLYVSQKEVSAFPSCGTSRAQLWSLLQQVLRALGRLQPAAVSPCDCGAGTWARWQGLQLSGSAGVSSLLPLAPCSGH